MSPQAHRFEASARSSGKQVKVTIWGQSVSVTGGDEWHVAFADIISASLRAHHGSPRTQWYCDIGVRDAGWRSLRMGNRKSAERLATAINAAVEGQRRRTQATGVAAAPGVEPTVDDVGTLLLSLAELHRAGMLSDEDHAAKKAELLRRI